MREIIRNFTRRGLASCANGYRRYGAFGGCRAHSLTNVGGVGAYFRLVKIFNGYLCLHRMTEAIEN